MYCKYFLAGLFIFIASCNNKAKEKEQVVQAPYTIHDRAYDYAMNADAKTLALTDSLIAARAPEMEKAYYSKAIYFTNTGKHEEALINYNKAIEMRYNFLDAHLDKGILLYDLKRYAEAMKTFDRAIQIDAAVAEFYLWMARTQQAMGKKPEAKLSYEKAYGLDEEMTEAKDSADKL